MTGSGFMFDRWLTPKQRAEMMLPESESKAVVDEVYESVSPRHAAVLADAYLERLMEVILDKAVRSKPHLQVEVDKAYTFKRMTRLLLSEGIIEDATLVRELDLLRDIRDEFAHDWTPRLEFASRKIAPMIGSLTIPSQLEDDGARLETLAAKWRHSFHGAS